MFILTSRRRHTRYWRDWSSDVCSSDLPVRAGSCHLLAGERLRDAVGRRGRVVGMDVPAALLGPQGVEAGELVRSEAELGQQDAGDRARVAAAELLGAADLSAGTRLVAQHGRLAGIDRGAAVGAGGLALAALAE